MLAAPAQMLQHSHPCQDELQGLSFCMLPCKFTPFFQQRLYLHSKTKLLFQFVAWHRHTTVEDAPC